jgi:ketosteroid isomerase-like protein
MPGTTSPSPTATPAPALTPREVFETLLSRITAGEWERLASLYAEDAVVDIPFALPAPVRLRGLAEIAAHFDAALGGPISFSAHDIVVHETTDPEVIVAEWNFRGRVTPTGSAVDVANIQRLRVRDGLIVSTRDFHNHAALAASAA